MGTRPQHAPSEGPEGINPKGTPEDDAVRHITRIIYIHPEIKNALAERKSDQAVRTVVSELQHHIDGLHDLRTKLRNFELQLSIPKLEDAYKRLQDGDKISEQQLAYFARETYQVGKLLEIPGCNVGTHVEEMKLSAGNLLKAVNASDPSASHGHYNVIQFLMDSLLRNKDEHFREPIQLLHQNFLILQSKSNMTAEDVKEWQKALREFPPVA